MTAPVDDIDRIMTVMQAAFDPQYGEAWTRRQVEDALLVGNCRYGLAMADENTDKDCAGFALSRIGVDEEELLLIAVAPPHRRRGIAARLLADLALAARERGATRLLLEMRRDNPAVTLYQKFGFAQIGERKHYYRRADGTRADALTFAYELP